VLHTLVYAHLSVCRILENRSSDAAVFFYRQFWTCIKVCARFDHTSGITALTSAFQSLNWMAGVWPSCAPLDSNVLKCIAMVLHLFADGKMASWKMRHDCDPFRATLVSSGLLRAIADMTGYVWAVKCIMTSQMMLVSCIWWSTALQVKHGSSVPLDWFCACCTERLTDNCRQTSSQLVKLLTACLADLLTRQHQIFKITSTVIICSNNSSKHFDKLAGPPVF